MKRFILLFFLIATLPAQSQTVTVRSGEHGSFTRLVLELPRGFAHRISRTGTGYLLNFGSMRPRFDLSQTYRLIGRERLRSIWAEPETTDLNLGIGCACHIIDTVLDGRFLVLDIKEGPPPLDSPNEMTAQGVQLSPLLSGETAHRPHQRPDLYGEIKREYDWLSSHQLMPSAQNTLLDQAISRQEEPSLTAFKEDLLQQIARSASDGRVAMRPTPDRGEKTDFDETIPEVANLPIAVHGHARLTAKGVVCIPDEQMNVAAWAGTKAEQVGPPPDIAGLLAQARQGLIAEFDTVDPEVLVRAARTYVHFGFGAEARALLKAFGGTSANHTPLWDMTFLVDGEQPEGDALAGQASCSGRSALWGLLSEARISQTSVDAQAVTQAFVSLPAHLQESLGPLAAKRLQEAGSRSAADLVLSAIGRLPEARTEPRALAAAEIALSRNRLDDAAASLAEVAPVKTSAQQAILTAELAWRRGTPLSAADLTTLEAHHFAEGEGPDGQDLSKALARAQALSGRAPEALTLAPDAETRAEIWAYIASAAPDSSFLDATARASDAERNSLPQEIRNNVARRLLDLELPVLAGDWLPVRTEQPVLTARLALLRGDATEALASLDQVTGEEAEALRSSALRALGQQPSYATEPAPNAQDETDLLPQQAVVDVGFSELTVPQTSSETLQVSETAQPDLSALAQESGLRPGQASLAMSRDLLERSRSTREAINQTLGSLPPP